MQKHYKNTENIGSSCYIKVISHIFKEKKLYFFKFKLNLNLISNHTHYNIQTFILLQNFMKTNGYLNLNRLSILLFPNTRYSVSILSYSLFTIIVCW